MLAISSPVVASWFWAGCVIFLDPMELRYREDDWKGGTLGPKVNNDACKTIGSRVAKYLGT